MRTNKRKKIVRPRIPMLVPDTVNERGGITVAVLRARGRRCLRPAVRGLRGTGDGVDEPWR